MQLRTLVAVAVLWPSAATVGAQAPARSAPRITAARVAHDAIVLDGRLDESAWATATPAGAFVQREPEPGLESSEATEARVLFDDRAIYIGMRMHERRPDGVRAQLSRRDGTAAASDWAAVMIDSYFDRRTAFKFATTPYGVRNDAMLFEDTREDATWDAVWEVATSQDAEGWTAEFRIPLSQLRFARGADGRHDWGIQFSREVAHLREVSHWAPVLPTDGAYVSLFGSVETPATLTPPLRAEVLPYTVGRLEMAPGTTANPFYDPRATSQAAGADLKVGLTSNLTLTATINPDFGQVEADPSVVNLGAFENFFPERRPFFTEGAEIFRFSLVPEGFVFYSRRVGRPPQRSVSPPAGGYVDAPSTSRIIGAAKVSGKTASGWSLGLLGAVTEATDARIADSAGAISRAAIEPRTTHLVARVMRDFRRGQSGFGGIATFLDRDLSDPSLQSLRDRAYATGINGWHRFWGNRYEVTGWVLGTQVEGSAAAIAATQRNAVHRFQRPDATHLTYDSTLTSLGGTAGEVYARKITGRWIGHLGAGWRSPGVDVNDAGYQTYADVWYLYPRIQYRQFQPGPRLRNWSVAAGFVPSFTFGGERGREEYILTGTAQLRNFTTATVSVERWEESDNTVYLRGGSSIIEPGYTIAEVSAVSDRRRRIAGEASVRTEYAEVSDRRLLTLRAGLTAIPAPSLLISLTPSLQWNRDPAQYVRTIGSGTSARYIAGALEQRTASVVMRASYAMTADLALDVYLQPFISVGDYARYREVVAPRNRYFNNRFLTFADDQIAYDAGTGRYAVDVNRDAVTDYSFPDADFSVREFRSNVVLRWEFTPGSTVFLVWSEARDDRTVVPGFDILRESRRLFTAPARDVFLLKVSYWLGR